MQESNNLSHSKWSHTIDEALNAMRERIVSGGDLPHASVQEQLDLLEQLPQFELGRYLLERGGINAYWTDYILTQSHLDNLDPEKLNPVEAFIYYCSPTAIAHRERIELYQREARKLLKEGSSFASIPCGVMRDLLGVDYSGVKEYTIVGVDLDPEALGLAKALADKKGLSDHLELLERDAWDLGLDGELDLIVSHGLSVYEPDRANVIRLYREFFKALKPGGTLIISALTAPPRNGVESEWVVTSENKKDIAMDTILYYEVLQPKWQNFKTLQELSDELSESGFSSIKIEKGSLGIVPAFIAKKD